MSIWKKLIATVLSAAMCAGLNHTVIIAEGEEEAFAKFCEETFVKEMENDYLTMHYTVKDYRSFSIEKPARTIGDASWESFAYETERCQNILKELRSFDYDKLNDAQKTLYRTYEQYLEDMAELNSYPMLSPYFEPASGIHENLLTNLTEFIFYNTEDIDDYLEVLTHVEDYFKEALEVTKRQAAAGSFMRDDMLDMTEEAINDFTAKKEDSQLIIIFNERIDEMEGLSDEEKQAYKDRNRDIVLNQIIPLYETTGKELEKLRGSRSYEGGVCNYPDGGKEYYEALVKVKTSCDDSIEEQFEDCSEFLEYLIDEYIALYMKNNDIDELLQTEKTKLDDPEKVLSYLQSHLDNFPEGPKVTYESDFLDPSVANDATVAYYLTPPIDDFSHNIIRINPAGVSEDDPNTLYSTLAHEGFPGHLFQITWFMNTNPDPLRSAYSFIGYQEGWGMYSEWCAWETSDIDKDAAKLNAIYVALSYVEDAAVDLAVNGMGWDTDDVADWLNSIGFNASSAQDLCDFVIQRPGLILPYGTGMMRFIKLREECEEELGSKFSQKEFHRVLLEGGDRPFEMVEEDVEAYINGLNGSAQVTPPLQPPVPSAIPWENNELIYDFQHKPDYTAVYVGAGIFTLIGVISAIALWNRKKKGPLA